jgi:hypothetical protein
LASHTGEVEERVDHLAHPIRYAPDDGQLSPHGLGQVLSQQGRDRQLRRVQGVSQVVCQHTHDAISESERLAQLLLDLFLFADVRCGSDEAYRPSGAIARRFERHPVGPTVATDGHSELLRRALTSVHDAPLHRPEERRFVGGEEVLVHRPHGVERRA